MKVTEIREDDDVKLDDEFAKTFGMDDLAALKTALSDQLSRQHEAALRNQTKTSLLDALDELTTFAKLLSSLHGFLSFLVRVW